MVEEVWVLCGFLDTISFFVDVLLFFIYVSGFVRGSVVEVFVVMIVV